MATYLDRSCPTSKVIRKHGSYLNNLEDTGALFESEAAHTEVHWLSAGAPAVPAGGWEWGETRPLPQDSSPFEEAPAHTPRLTLFRGHTGKLS